MSISNSKHPNDQRSARLSSGAAARLLRTHIGGRAEHMTTLDVRGRQVRRRLRSVDGARTFSPGRSRGPSPFRLDRWLDVGRLQIAMDDAPSCAASSASAIWLRDAQCFPDVEEACPQSAPRVSARR